MVSGSAAYDRIKERQQQQDEQNETSQEHGDRDGNGKHDHDQAVDPENEADASDMAVEEEPPVIDPKQCLFDKTIFATVEENVEYMEKKYGFFIPDREYLVDLEGLLGYCHEKIKLGHCCLYCQKIFRTWQACQQHMISTRHTKLLYERGADMEEFDPFYDFSQADAEFLGSGGRKNGKQQQEQDLSNIQDGSNDQAADAEMGVNENDEDGEWEDMSDAEGDDEDMVEDDGDDDDDDDMYGGYEDEIARFGLDVSPLGELVFPDGRIIGHRGLARYYKQRAAPVNDSSAVAAARRAAGERLYRGRVYQIGAEEQTHETSLALARAGITPGTATGRKGNGVLVKSGSNGYTALSLYRYRAVVKKAHRDEARGQRLEFKSTRNINRMDKKANRLMNGVSVAHAAR